MKIKTYFLNNTGSRMVQLDETDRRVRVELLNENNEVIAIRRAKYFYSIGDFSGVAVNLKGKVYKTLNYRLV